jgi:hypothetical protein
MFVAIRIGLGVVGIACIALTVVYGVDSHWWLGTTVASLGLVLLNFSERKVQGG